MHESVSNLGVGVGVVFYHEPHPNPSTPTPTPTNHTITSSNTSDSELFMYEYEREINRNENPLRWWNENKQKYPLLSKLACKYLCITGTSVPSERMFSATGYLTSDRRSKLTPENANVLLFLNKNLPKNVD